MFLSFFPNNASFYIKISINSKEYNEIKLSFNSIIKPFPNVNNFD